MEWQTVQSSNIAAVGYDAEALSLFVEFNGGSVYRYDGVPRDVFDRMVASESKGRFLATDVRPKPFRYSKLSQDQIEDVRERVAGTV